MTAKKDLKRRVRERQAKTGESYATARARVTASTEKPPAIPVVELIDASEDAAKLGLQCDVLVSPGLAERIAPVRILERLRNALIATDDDPQTRVLRSVVLRGEAPVGSRRNQPDWWEDVRRFFARAQVGIGGFTDAGNMMALQIDDVMVIVQTGHVPHIPRPRRRVFLTTADAHVIEETMIVPR
jgi:hypothetical protein